MVQNSRFVTMAWCLAFGFVAWCVGGAVAQDKPGSQQISPSVNSAETEFAESKDPNVIAGTSEPDAELRLFVYAEYNEPPILLDETVADSGGRFKLQRDSQFGDKLDRYFVVATKPNFASTIERLRSSTSTELKIRLKAVARLTGVVTDEQGKPVVDSQVTVQSMPHPIPGIQSARTNKDGYFETKDVERWKAKGSKDVNGTGMTSIVVRTFRVLHPRFAPCRTAYSDSPTTVNVVLPTPSVLSGQVLDLVTGKPLAHVQVEAEGIGRGLYLFQTETDDIGRYELPVGEDSYNVWANVEERMPLAAKAVFVEQGEHLEGIDIQMVRGSYVTGKVVGPVSGDVVNGREHSLRILHQGPARPLTGRTFQEEPVGEDGSYRIHVAPGRNYVFLSGGNGEFFVDVGDGKEIVKDMLVGEIADPPMQSDPDFIRRSRLQRQSILGEGPYSQAPKME
jgi:5-hydroxyisourate hydrolase-like protein (transthyretin family)